MVFIIVGSCLTRNVCFGCFFFDLFLFRAFRIFNKISPTRIHMHKTRWKDTNAHWYICTIENDSKFFLKFFDLHIDWIWHAYIHTHTDPRTLADSKLFGSFFLHQIHTMPFIDVSDETFFPCSVYFVSIYLYEHGSCVDCRFIILVSDSTLS